MTLDPKSHYAFAVDGTIISGLLNMDAWHRDLGNPNDSLIGLLNATSNIAGFVIGPVICWADDKFGRRWGIRCEFCLTVKERHFGLLGLRFLCDPQSMGLSCSLVPSSECVLVLVVSMVMLVSGDPSVVRT